MSGTWNFENNNLVTSGLINANGGITMSTGGSLILNTGVVLSTYGGVSTDGLGLPIIIQSTLQSNTVPATVRSFTVPATDTEYHFSGTMEISSYVSGYIELNLAFTTPFSTVYSFALNGLNLGGGSSVNFSSNDQILLNPFNFRAKGGSTVTFSTTGTLSGTWHASVRLLQMG